MGACHSQLAIEADGFDAFDPVVKSPRRRGPKALKISIPSPGKSSKNRIVRLFSPSEDTAPITPASVFSNPPHENDLCGISPMAPLQALREYEEASFSSSDASSTSSYTRLFKSNKNKTDMGQSVIKSVIAEEAPSNETESHEIEVQEMHEDGDTAIPLSTKSQDRVKNMNRHSTGPKSTIYRPTAPLVAPPKGSIVSDTLQKPLKASVSPHTITDFNKLKLQVQVAAKTEKMKKHKEKVEDRYLDVKGYRNLWNSFEKMKLEVEEASANKENVLPDDDDASTMSLQEPDTWFFDFNNSSRNYSLAMDDIQSTVSFSMLSEANLETQRKFYRERAKQRQNKKPNRYKHKGPLQERQGGYNTSNSSFGSFSTKQSAISDYGPIKRVASMSTLSISGFNETGTTFSSENSREVDRSGSILSDLERNNDYNVTRRQRQKVVDVSSQREFVSSLLESTTNYNSDSSQDNDSYGSGFINDEYTNSALKRSVPDSPSRVQQYGFDPSAPLSSQLDVFAMPSIEIEDSMTGVVRWRKFEKDDDKKPSRKLDFGANATPKKGNVSTETESSEIPVDEVEETSSKKDKALEIKTNLQTLEVNPFWDMSSEHFLMMSTPRSLLDSDKEEQDEKKALYESFRSMSTEQFMMMSAFKSPSPQDLESDEDYTSRTEDNDSEPSKDAGEVESTTESPESSTVDGSENCQESDPYLDAVTSHSETMASPNPASAASEDLDNAIDLMDDFDFWDIERRRLSIDQCDELANQVSGQLSSLLRRFREDNRR